jgi:hypothetical protein
VNDATRGNDATPLVGQGFAALLVWRLAVEKIWTALLSGAHRRDELFNGHRRREADAR